MKNNSNIISLARKKSSDPKQENLRQSKQDFNEEVSNFISELIEFKKSINGRGSPKLNIKPNKIQEPPPSELYSILTHLNSKYNKISGDGTSILNKQNDYSKSRKKSKKSQANSDYLNKNASWWGSRLMTRFQLGDSTRKQRLEMMESCIEMINLIDNIQDSLSPSEYMGVIESADNFINLYNIYNSNILLIAKYLKEESEKSTLKELPDLSEEPAAREDEAAQERPAQSPRNGRTPRRGGGAATTSQEMPSDEAEEQRETGPNTSDSATNNNQQAGQASQEGQGTFNRDAYASEIDELSNIFLDIEDPLNIIIGNLPQENQDKINNIYRDIQELITRMRGSRASAEVFISLYEQIVSKYLDALDIAKTLVGGRDVNSFAEIVDIIRRGSRSSTASNPYLSIESKEIKKLAKLSFNRLVNSNSNNISKVAKNEALSRIKDKIKKNLDSILNQLEKRNLNTDVLLEKLKILNENLLELCLKILNVAKPAVAHSSNEYNHIKYQINMQRMMSRTERDRRTSRYEELSSIAREIFEMNNVLKNQVAYLLRIENNLKTI